LGGGAYSGTIPTRYQGTNAANPADWPGGVTWMNQLANWSQTIETAFANYNAANGTDYQFIPNLDARVTSWEPNWYDNANGVPFIDGAFLEGFGEYTDTYNWTFSMNQGLNLTDNGKIVIMQPYPSADPSTAAGQQQVNFLLGTYLLLKGNETYINIDDGGGVQYYPQYELNLGSAVTPLPSNVSGYLWNGVYRRNFQNGFVLVNPGNTTYTLNLGGNYQLVQGTGGGTMTDADLDANGNYIGASLTYQNVSSVTLTGGSAAIFLDNSVAGTTTALTTSANPLVYGQPVTFTTKVTPTGSGTPTGIVTFMDGSNTLGTQTLSQGTAAFTTSTLAVGSQSITAVYSGDANDAASSSPSLTETVNEDGTVTALDSTIASVFGQDITFTAIVSVNSPGAGTPNSGIVTFFDGSTPIGTAKVSGGVATDATSALSVGAHTITASYGGDGVDFLSSPASAAVTQVVSQDSTTTAIASSANPSVNGQPVTIVATVTANLPGSGMPIGTVTFKVNGTAQPGVMLNAQGQAVFTYSPTVGAYNVTATYNGGTNYTSSASATLHQVVSKDASLVSLVSSLNPAIFGQQVTFSATVTAMAPGSGTPTGTISFRDNGVTLASVPLDSKGGASFTTSTLAAGNPKIVAVYAGSSSFKTSTAATLIESVTKDATAATLLTSLNPSTFGIAVTFTVTVSALSPGSGTPTGTITFASGSSTIGTATLNSNGTATLTISRLPVGTDRISAAYSGDKNFKTTKSAILLEKVNPASADALFAALLASPFDSKHDDRFLA
jgi:hypothetical protein